MLPKTHLHCNAILLLYISTILQIAIKNRTDVYGNLEYYLKELIRNTLQCYLYRDFKTLKPTRIQVKVLTIDNIYPSI